METLVLNATRTFTGADWTHVYQDKHGHTDKTPSGGLRHCRGYALGCQVCADARRDAQRCAEWGREALALWAAGDREAAREYIEQAYRTESEWGDAPSWGPVLEWMEEHMD